MQLEFDFTWFVFCELHDEETGEVVGGAVLECFHDEFGFIVASFEYDNTSPWFAVPVRKSI